MCLAGGDVYTRTKVASARLDSPSFESDRNDSLHGSNLYQQILPKRRCFRLSLERQALSCRKRFWLDGEKGKETR